MRNLYLFPATLLCFGMLFFKGSAIAQVPVNFTQVGEYVFPFTWPNYYSGHTPLFDKLGRDYIYLSSLELGLVTFDVSDPTNPFPVDTMPPALFNGLNVNSLAQDSNILFVGIGRFQGVTQKAGLAILDVSDPVNKTILDIWDSTAFVQGCAAIALDGDFCYLGAMEDGVLVMNTANRSNIQFVSQFVPNDTFGNPPLPPNARGFFVRGNELFLGYDGGGLRVLNIADKQNLAELGMYVNPDLTDSASAAYNGVYCLGNYAYIPVDFCGLDVVDISDPANMNSVAWNNP